MFQGLPDKFPVGMETCTRAFTGWNSGLLCVIEKASRGLLGKITVQCNVKSLNLVAVVGKKTANYLVIFVQSSHCWDWKTCPLYRIAGHPHFREIKMRCPHFRGLNSYTCRFHCIVRLSGCWGLAWGPLFLGDFMTSILRRLGQTHTHLER